MVNLAAKILLEDYEIEREKVVTIPHGVPVVRPIATQQMKRASFGSRGIPSSAPLDS